MPTQVLAAGPDEATPTELDDALMQKDLVMDANLTTPAYTFTFNFDAISVNEDPAAQSDMPTIDDKTLTFAATDTGTSAGAIKTVNKNISISTILGSTTFPHAGVYIYDVTETTDATPHEGVTYSTEKYRMRIFVENGENEGDPLEVVGVTVSKVTGTAPSEDEEKVDPTKGGAEGFVFTNQYDATSDLRIEKEVSGAYGDTTKQFDFFTTLTGPASKPFVKDDTFTGVIHRNDSTTENITFTVGDDLKAVTTTAYTLAHGEYITFDSLPVGTTYMVEEKLTTTDGAEAYTPSAKVTYGSDLPVDLAAASTPGVDYEVEGDGTNDTINTTIAEESGNKTLVINEYQDITPTGILLKNLPFILLIVIAVAGMVLFIAAKRRRNAAR